MAFVVESPSARWGYYEGGDAQFGTTPAFHDPRVPYPHIDQTISLIWHQGDGPGRLMRPDICSHNMLRDFVCTRIAFEALTRWAPDDIHVVATAVCDQTPLWVIQIVAVRDVADASKSLPEGRAQAWMEWPFIPTERESEISDEIFRLPDPGPPLMVLAGNALVNRIGREGLTGLEFTELAQVI